MRRVLALVAVAVAWLGTPSLAAAQSTVSVRMTGAGTVSLEVVSGTPADTVSCPSQPDLTRSDVGQPYQACAVPFAPTCAPASGSTCALRVRATLRLPGPPAIDAGQAGGWKLLPWTSGPCAGVTTACVLTIGSCTAAGCTYADAALGAAFDDIRDPTAVFYGKPAAVERNPEGQAVFLLGSNETAGPEVSTLICVLDGKLLSTCNRRPAAAVLTGLSDGQHTLEIQATDPSGNTGPEVSYTWRQVLPPVVTFDAGPAPGASVPAGDATFAFHANRPSTLTCRLDGGDATPCADGTFEASGLGEGRHVLEVTARRSDFDITSVTAREWIVDTVPPESVLTGTPDFESRSRSATFSFGLAGGAPGGRFECSLDGAGFVPCDGPAITYTGLAPGPHTFAVRAVDAAGNREDPPQLADWMVVVDEDADGASPPEDCDDANAAVFPFAEDPAGNGVDEDCDGVDGMDGGFGTDADGDGDPAFPDGQDCDDGDPDVNSFGSEVPENGVDEDCDGADRVIPGAAVRFRARWTPTRSGARLAALTAVRVPADTVLRLKVTCPKKACERRVKRTTVEKTVKGLDLLPYLPRLGALPAGAVLEVRASRSGRHPEGTEWTVRARRQPRTTEFCVRRGKRELGRC